LHAVLSGLAAVLGSWLAATLGLSSARMQALLALGAGFLLGGALLTMVPFANRASERGGLFVALGYLGMFAFRSGLSQRSHHAGTAGDASRASAVVTFLGLLLHTVIDGAALGAATGTGDRAVALAAFLAVALHKLPEGFTLGAVVLAATGSARLAVGAGVALGVGTVAGAGLSLSAGLIRWLSPSALMGLAAGSFLYVGATDVLPGLLGRGRRTATLVVVGAAVIFLLTRSHHVH